MWASYWRHPDAGGFGGTLMPEAMGVGLQTTALAQPHSPRLPKRT